MKKLGTLLLCFGLLFSIASCAKKDPIDDKALDKLEAVIKQTMKYQSGSYQLDVDSTADKETATVKATGDFVYSEKPQFSLILDIITSGQSYKDFADVYVYENALYLNIMGSKVKSTYTSTEDSVKDIKDKGTKIDHKSLKKILKEASFDNDKITIVVDGKKVTNYLQDKKDDSKSLSKVYKNIGFQDIKLVITYDSKEYLTGLSANVTMKANKESASLSMDLNISKRDKVTKIDLPENLNEYKEQDVIQQDGSSLLPGSGL